jgi:hypothetical protein
MILKLKTVKTAVTLEDESTVQEPTLANKNSISSDKPRKPEIVDM